MSIRFRNRTNDHTVEYVFGLLIQRYWEAGYYVTLVEFCFGIWSLTIDHKKRGVR